MTDLYRPSLLKHTTAKVKYASAMKVGIAELELHSKKFFRLSPQHTLSEILTDKVCCVFVSGRLAFTLDSFSDPGQIVATFQLPRCATNIAALDEKLGHQAKGMNRKMPA